MNTPTISVKLFGGFELRRPDGVPIALNSRTARSVLAYLIVNRDRAQTRERLTGVFWPDYPETQARRRLSQSLWKIGEALGPDWLEADSLSVRLNPEWPVQLDLTTFEQVFLRGSPEATDAALAQSALDAYRGEFMAGYNDDWVLEARDQFHNAFLIGLERLSRGAEARGDFERALELARRMVSLEPLREQAHREVMRLCLILGRPREALEQFERCRKTLLLELGEEPSPQTRALYQRIQLGETTTPERAPLELDQTLPLVGREAERAALLEALELARHGSGGVVLLEAEPGLGKSRLLTEIAQDAAWRGFEVRHGHGQEWGGLEPYTAVRELLSTDLTPLRVELLSERVDGLWLREVGRIVKAFERPASAVASLPPEHEGSRLREAITRTILALGQIAPQLIVLDDLQWLDEASLEWLEGLSRAVEHAGVLIVLGYRPAEARERPAVWRMLEALDREGGKRVRLEPLPPAEVALLVRRALGTNLQTPLESRLQTEGQGNPLFVLETLRAVIEQGGLAQTGQDVGELPLPGSVREVMVSRLTRLEPRIRTVLDAAAVIGTDLDGGLCVAASGFSRAATLEALDVLVRRGFLGQTETGIRFSHDRLRQIVYAELPDSERRALHAAVGRALEQGGTDDAGLLARHFDQGGVWDKAFEFHRRAAENAKRVYAYTTALEHLDRALALSDQVHLGPDERFELCSLAEGVFALAGRRDDQLRMIEAMASLAQGNAVRGIQVCGRRVHLYNELSRPEEAIEAGRTALDLTVGLEGSAHHAEALEGMGDALSWANRFEEAERHFRQAIHLHALVGDRHGEARVRHALGQAMLNRLDPGAGTELEAALDLYQQLGNLNGQTGATVLLAHFYRRRGETELAEAKLRQALEISRSIGYRRAEALCCLNLGNLLCEQLRVSQGLELHAQAIPIFDTIGDVNLATLTRLNTATMKIRVLGDLESAMREATQALETYRAMRSVGGEGQALGALGRIYWYRGEHELARATLESGMNKVHEGGNRFSEVYDLKDLAEITVEMGRPLEALEHLDRAEAIIEQHDFEMARPAIKALRARVAFERDELHEALELIRAALTELGDGALLAERLLHFEVLSKLGHSTEARAVIAEAHRELMVVVGALYPEHRQISLERIPTHHAIIEAWEATHLKREVVRLPRADAPTGRALRDGEFVDVLLTRSEPEDNLTLDKKERRQRQLERLMREAFEQGAAPTVDDLAQILGSSRATVKRDLAELRRTGNDPRTRGRRGSEALTLSAPSAPELRQG